jgi:hypothetical protein
VVRPSRKGIQRENEAREKKNSNRWANIQPGSERQKAIGGMQTRGGGTNGKKQMLNKSSREA